MPTGTSFGRKRTGGVYPKGTLRESASTMALYIWNMYKLQDSILILSIKNAAFREAYPKDISFFAAAKEVGCGAKPCK